MAYDEQLAKRVEKVLLDKNVAFVAKPLMSGLCFNVDDKMCVGVGKNKETGEGYLIARVGEKIQLSEINSAGCQVFAPTGRPMKDFLRIDAWAVMDDEALTYWIDFSLAFNPLAKSSKKKAHN